MAKLEKSLGFADLAVEKRKIKSEFYNQIDYLIDFQSIEKEIELYYKKGNSAAGRPSHRGIVLFKMCLLGYFYDLSDYEVEERVKDSISTSRFVGLGMEDEVPDHSSISRFRTALTEANAMDKLLNFINLQLERACLLVKKGVIIDASFTESERKSKKQVIYEIADDRKEDDRSDETKAAEESHQKLIKAEEPGVDSEARWLKKGNTSLYGYKKHTCTDKNGLVIAIETTAGNESDTQLMETVIEKSGLTNGTEVYADKGYSSKSNRNMLKERRLRSRIMHKKEKNKDMSTWAKKFNKSVSKIRYAIERTFGGMKRWGSGGKARYIGKAKNHTQHIFEAIAYNLYRLPVLFMRRNAILPA